MTNIDGVLVTWGDRLFYPGNRRVRGDTGTPRLTSGLHDRAAVIRARIAATVVRRAPQVMVKVTGGGRGMAAIAAHLRYISKSGRLEIEDDRGLTREGREAVQEVVEQWRFGGSRIPEVSQRREAFNIMLSMPMGTRPDDVRGAARAFAKTELANHRYVMVLHEHQANPHVHISVRAEGRDGRRLNPRKEDLRRWREVFAEKLRERGIEAEATPQMTRGARHRNERIWERKTSGAPMQSHRPRHDIASPSRERSLRAWFEIGRALAASPDASDRQLSEAIVRFVNEAPALRELLRAKAQARQRQLPGVDRERLPTPTRARQGPELSR